MYKSFTNWIGTAIMAIFIIVGFNAQATYGSMSLSTLSESSTISQMTNAVENDVEPEKGMPTKCEPASNSEVSTLSYIRMTFSKEDYPYGLSASGVAKLYNSSDEYVTEGTYVVDSDNNWVVYLNLKQVVTTAGTYTLRVAEGDISEYVNSSNKCPSFEVSYTVVSSSNNNAGPESITPQSGTNVEELGIIYLKFSASDYPNGMAVNSSAMIPVYDSNGLEVAKAKTTLDYTDNTSLTVKCSIKSDNGYTDRVITDAGSYTITIPEGSIWDKADIFKYVPQVDLSYKVGEIEEVKGMPTKCEPASNSEVSTLSYIRMTFSKEDYPYGLSASGVAKLYNSSDEYVTEGTYVVDSDNNWVVYLNLKQVVTTAGTYTLRVAEGDISEYVNSSNKCPSFEVSYTVVSSSNNNAGPESITPQSGTNVEELGIIYLKFSASDYPNGMGVNSSAMIPVYDSNGLEVAKAKTTLDYTDNTSLTVKCSIKSDNGYTDRVITDAGSYTITIPEGSIWDKADIFKYVPQVDLSYKVGEIEEVKGMPTKCEPASNSEVSTLSYIRMTFSKEDYPYGLSASGVAKLYNSSDEYVTEGTYVVDSDNNWVVYLNLKQVVTTAGTYTLRVAEGDISEYVNSSNKCPSFEVSYTVVSSSNNNAGPESITPQSGTNVEELGIIYLKFSASDYPNGMGVNSSAMIPVYDSNGLEVAKAKTTLDYTDNTSLTVKCSIKSDNGYTDRVITDAGSYTITIPEGSIWDKADIFKYVPQVDLSYKVGEIEEVKGMPTKCEPASNSEVSTLSYIRMTFSKEDYPYGLSASGVAKLYNSSDEYVTEGTYVVDSDNNWVVYLNLKQVVTTASTYTLRVAEGDISEYLNSSNKCPSFEVSYTVVSSSNNNAGPESITPQSGTNVEELGIIYLKFSASDYPNGMGVNSSAMIPVYDSNGLEVAKAKTTLDYTDNTSLTVKCSIKSDNGYTDRVITDAGSYTITIPEGSIWDKADIFKYVPQVDLSYNVEAKPCYSIVVSPEAGEVSTDDLKEITITFEGVSSIEFSEIVQPGNLYKIDEDGAIIYEYQLVPMIISDVAYTLTPSDFPTEKGLYRLIIPAESIYVTDNNGVIGSNKEYFVDYSVTEVGITIINAESKCLNVYSIEGICILRNASMQDINNLQKGIYIINGKKVIIR